VKVLPNGLMDKTNTYTYGLGNLGQTSSTSTDYFLGDALDSTRQLTDASGSVALAQSYDPFGAALQSSGVTQTSFGFDGQQTDPTGLQYLRARTTTVISVGK
jgi:hypothetical protein